MFFTSFQKRKESGIAKKVREAKKTWGERSSALRHSVELLSAARDRPGDQVNVKDGLAMTC